MNETQTGVEPSTSDPMETLSSAAGRMWLRLTFGDKFRAIRSLEIMPGANRQEIRDRLRARRFRNDGKLRGSE